MHDEFMTPSKPPDTSAAAVERVAEALERTGTLIFTADAYILSGRNRHHIRLFLDTGSTLTSIKPHARDLIPNSRPLHKAKLNIQAYSSSHETESTRFKIVLSSSFDDSRVEIFAYEHDSGVHSGSECLSALRTDDFAQKHRLADSSLISQQSDPLPAMLVGNHQFYKIGYFNREKLLFKNIVAKETRFGWIIGGPMKRAVKGFVSSIRDACCAATLSAAARDVDRLWSLDSI